MLLLLSSLLDFGKLAVCVFHISHLFVFSTNAIIGDLKECSSITKNL